MVRIGQKIPNLSFEIFQNGDIKEVNFESYAGKWIVLFFYPADFTFVCPTELEGLADSYSIFKELGAEVISVSRDTAFVHKAWHSQSSAIKKINYPMASDLKGELCEAFGTFEEEGGLSLRSTYIIDPNGIAKSFEINDNSIGRNVNETIRKLQAAIFTSKNGGKVCPLNWTPDKEALSLPSLSIFEK